jgi:alpha-D-ribose 1-methylphosphonate 5-triphosphate synthase subunit PhnG
VRSVTPLSYTLVKGTVMTTTYSIDDRKAVLALLARATRPELADPLGRNWPDIVVRDLRKPEIGLAMLRGRMGGDGAPFNLGEATVTRAVVELAGGQRGHGQRLGRDATVARLSAIVDALWQDEAERPRIERDILTPIRARLASMTTRTRSETAATRVDFFTMVRGDG